jgi:putative transcriptional regulator
MHRPTTTWRPAEMATPARTPPERELVYNRLPLLRANRGISRNELAEALGIHYQTVGYIERGEYSPSLYLALRIARYFDLPVEAVFSTEPFGPLGADALIARPTSTPESQEPPHA